MIKRTFLSLVLLASASSVFAADVDVDVSGNWLTNNFLTKAVSSVWNNQYVASGRGFTCSLLSPSEYKNTVCDIFTALKNRQGRIEALKNHKAGLTGIVAITAASVYAWQNGLFAKAWDKAKEAYASAKDSLGLNNEDENN